jgi:oligopeptide transport system ATP-binding protein
LSELDARFIKRYPHEFSGDNVRGSASLELWLRTLISLADEPISALDVSIQAQIMNLMDRLQSEFSLTYLFISHDLRAVKHISDRVMYLGEIVELASAKELYERPLMPYTRTLISAVPVPDPQIVSKRRRIVLAGDVPSPINPPTGCRFHARCPYALHECSHVKPCCAKSSQVISPRASVSTPMNPKSTESLKNVLLYSNWIERKQDR